MKRALELDIAECKARFEEQRRSDEVALRTHYENELLAATQNYQQMSDLLQLRQVQLDELDGTYKSACAQYEEQIKRLNDK